jgi:hypothetical protein
VINNLISALSDRVVRGDLISHSATQVLHEVILWEVSFIPVAATPHGAWRSTWHQEAEGAAQEEAPVRAPLIVGWHWQKSLSAPTVGQHHFTDMYWFVFIFQWLDRDLFDWMHERNRSTRRSNHCRSFVLFFFLMPFANK